MSYYLTVFDLRNLPPDRGTFLSWFDEVTKWPKGHDYNDYTATTPKLRAWFLDVIKLYPPLNGPLSDTEIAEDKVADYSIGETFIYASFAWSEAQNAYAVAFDLATKHGVGFYDTSSENGEVWSVDSDGSYVCLHSAKASEAEERKKVRVYTISAKKILKKNS